MRVYKNNRYGNHWQEWLNSSRTFSSVSENAILENGKEGRAEGGWMLGFLTHKSESHAEL